MRYNNSANIAAFFDRMVKCEKAMRSNCLQVVIFDEIENCTFFYGVSRMDNVGDAGTGSKLAGC